MLFYGLFELIKIKLGELVYLALLGYCSLVKVYMVWFECMPYGLVCVPYDLVCVPYDLV